MVTSGLTIGESSSLFILSPLTFESRRNKEHIPAFIPHDLEHDGDYSWVEAAVPDPSAGVIQRQHSPEGRPRAHRRTMPDPRMARRPHQLFSLALVIAGDIFWVSVWHHSGAFVSLAYNRAKVDSSDIDLLIRAVVQLGFRFSDEALSGPELLDVECRLLSAGTVEHAVLCRRRRLHDRG
jgi:hypothetical protein